MDRSCMFLKRLKAYGSFSKAAEALGVSQPYFSQVINKLEKKYGVELVARHNKPITLTPAGDVVLETERKIYELRQSCNKHIQDIEAGIRGKVTIGASHYRERFFLTQVLPIFRQHYPDIELAFEEGTTRQLEDYVLEGKTDFSLVIEPLYHPELESIAIYEEKLLLALSDTHPLAQQYRDEEYIDFALFDGEPFIIIKEGQKMRTLFMDLCTRTNTQPKVVLQSESLEAALSLSSVGLGATFTTETLVKRSKTPSAIRAFNLKPSLESRRIVAAHRADRYLSKAARALIAVMQNVGRMEFSNG